jgi:DNA-binding NarL/FixJ family response regulator/signal transduction histidine kinase
VFDRLLVAFLFVFAELEVLTSNALDGPPWLNVLVIGATALCLLFRRSHTLPAVAGVMLGLATLVVFLTPPQDLLSITLLLVSASYAAGAHLEGRTSLWGLAIVVGTVVTATLVTDPTDIFFPVAMFGVVPWLAGRTIRNQTMLARELAERAEQAEHAREEDERRAIAAERNRIARELHDVLAHNLSVMVVQAGAARRIVDRSPQKATEAAELIQRTGREALDELRALFGPVRRGEGEELSGPPSLARVDELARRARTAGLPVELRVLGEPVPLPTGIDLTAYRVVQEALTNAIKHAGAARAAVTVSYEPNEVVLTVEDDGGGRPWARGLRRRLRARGHARAGDPLRRSAPGRTAPRRRLRRPRAPAHAPARAGRRALYPAEQGDRMSVRVLLVDDQALIRAGFRMILDAEDDIEVVGECADGTQAVDSAHRLDPDVVLMDIRMPEMDGIEATRRIAGGNGDHPVRVLMLTTFDLDEYVYDALRAGASGFLLKDVPAEQLVEAIRVVAQGDALLAPSVTRRLISEFSRSAPGGRGKAPDSLDDLTPRELEVFGLIARGMSNAEIAAELVVSETTVKTHVARVLMKLGVRDRVQAVVLAYESGIVAPGEAPNE